MNNFWEIILHSNLFNFTIFFLIIVIIANKIDIPSVLDKMRTEVVKKIDNSEETNLKSKKDLQAAEISFAKTDDEIKDIKLNAKTSSEAMKSHIIDDAQKKVISIKQNTQNIINSEEKHIKHLLVSKLGVKSLDLAKNLITKELNSNKELHYKFINESIDALDKAVL